MPLPEPPRLIKAHSRHASAASTAFNIEDLRQRCDEFVAQARRQASELIAQAEARADAVRLEAFQEGRRDGQQAGIEAAQEVIEMRARELATEQLNVRLESLIPTIDRLVEGIEQEREQWMSEWESGAVRLSTVIAGKLLRRELSNRPEFSVEIVREALQLTSGIPRIKLSLHPDDLDLLRIHGKDVLDRLASVCETTFQADESLSRGGCLIETPRGVIDSRIETQLTRILDELLAS